jgi:hypothetical protein
MWVLPSQVLYVEYDFSVHPPLAGVICSAPYGENGVAKGGETPRGSGMSSLA